MLRHLSSKPAVLLALMALTALLVTACGPQAEELNQDGNKAFAKQAFEEALQAYATAQIESPELAEPYYNAANTLYRQEKYAEALEQIEQALSYAEDAQLAQNSLYNMGNSSFNTQEWEPAVEAYKSALLLDPDDKDAKYNLELALLQQQQEQQQEQENQEQEQEQEQSEEGEQQQEQEQSQEGDQQQEQEQSEEGDQQQEQEQSEEGDQQDEQNQEQENEKSENGDQQNPEDQKQDENQQNGEQDPNQQPQPGQIPPPGQRMTEEQARQLLQAIAQDSETLQERLGQYFIFPAGPPVQDW